MRKQLLIYIHYTNSIMYVIAMKLIFLMENIVYADDNTLVISYEGLSTAYILLQIDYDSLQKWSHPMMYD